MAEAGFEFMTALDDHVSAPAHAEAKALGDLKTKIEGVAGAEHKAGEAHGLLVGALDKGEESLKEFGSALIPQIALAELAAEALKKLGEYAIEGVKFALEASEFKENAMLAYEAVTGTAEEGERTFREIEKLANTIRMPAEKAHDLAQTLMIQGLENQQQLTAAVAAVGNLQRVGMQKGADRLQRILETSLASGHLELSKKTLRGTGLHLDAIVDDLAKRLHESRDQVKAQLAAGKIDAETGIASITDAINNGHIGDIAKKKFDLTDAVTIFKNEMRSIFEDVDTGPLKQALVDFVSLFDQGTAGGKDMHDAVTASISGIIAMISKAIEGFTLLALTVEASALQAYIYLFPYIDGVARVAKAIDGATESGSGFGSMLDHITDLTSLALGPFAQFADLAARIGDSLGNVLGTEIVGGRLGAEVAGAAGAPPVGSAVAAPHASGGVVPSPPPGEAFTAVKPGEMIVPADFSFPAIDYDRIGGQSGPANAGGHRIDFTWTGDVNVQNGGDHEEIRQTVTETMADMFEQLALEMGG